GAGLSAGLASLFGAKADGAKATTAAERSQSAAHSPPARVNKRCNMGQLCWADSRTEKRGASWSPDWAAITASSRRGRNDNSPTALLCPAAYHGSALDLGMRRWQG